jgi:hypothetical protein
MVETRAVVGRTPTSTWSRLTGMARGTMMVRVTVRVTAAKKWMVWRK